MTFNAVRTVALGAAVVLCPTLALAGPTDVLYLYGTKPPAIDDLRLDDNSRRGFSSFKTAVEEVGFNIEQKRVDQITLDAATLNQYQVVILSSNNRNFTQAEADAVDAWVRAGGGLIAWSDAAFGIDVDQDGQFDPGGIPNTVGLDSNNSITEQFGMQFLRDSAAGDQDVGADPDNKPYEFDNFLWQNDPDDGVIRFRGEGTSPIKVSGPARVLFKYENVTGNARLNGQDANAGIEIDDTIAALAIAEIGEGRVVGTFDRNTFFNVNGPGTDITEVDNEQFAQNLVIWASQIPEPTSLSLLVPAGVLMLRRRR